MRIFKFKPQKKGEGYPSKTKGAEKKNFGVTGLFVFNVWICDCEYGGGMTFDPPKALKD